MTEIVVTCECCGRPGDLIGCGQSKARCPIHRDVVDPGAWKKARAAMPALFGTEAEALEHFLADYGAGLDLVRELQRGICDDTRH